MGIKGIYRELGPGRRISLSKLAADSFQTSSRPYRVAIDVAIWQFQAQAARGGTNPAIRTLFYRLLRLVGTPVDPVFVFDGPRKPAFKRNKRSRQGDRVGTAQAKCLIRIFGYVVHDAPGEAEAECAFLQKIGVVDAVLSEDVDTIMFGCTKTLRNWSSESKSSSTPTHVSVYDVEDMKMADLGLDRDGMVLVALMSGGDYLPEGIPGCGIKVACEAAQAGFGKFICQLKTSDQDGLRAWRESLIHELKTNDKGYFRTKHKALVVPDNFPNLEVLRFYTHPVVSQESRIEGLRKRLTESQEINIDELREFTRQTFGWDNRTGAVKFIRVLGQAMLIHKFCQEQGDAHQYVKRISGRRRHFSTDGTPELRLSFLPSEVVPIDLSKEESFEESASYGHSGLALNSDVDFGTVEEEAVAADGSRTVVGSDYDVHKTQLTWVLESVARKSIPQAVQAWEKAEMVKAARKTTKKKASGTGSSKTAGMVSGSLDGFVRITKATGITYTAKGLEGAPGVVQQHSQVQGHHQCLHSDARLCSPPSTLSLRTSKQASSRRAAKPQASEPVEESSPVTPRPFKSTSLPETILISSSPVEPAPPQSPTAPPGRADADPYLPLLDGEEESDIIPLTATSATSRLEPCRGGGASHRRGPSLRTSAALDSPPARNIFKQSSLVRFLVSTVGRRGQGGASTTTRSPPTASSTTERQGAKETRTVISDNEDGGGSGLKLLPRPAARKGQSPIKRRQAGDDRCGRQQLNKPGVGPAAAPVKKKLIVPRAENAGFFDELELEAGDREARQAGETTAHRGRGARPAALRQSDVPVIDLTSKN